MRNYSGRGMYGRSCLAFESLEEFAKMIQLDATSENPVIGDESWEMDSMGRGIVIYSRNVTVDRWVEAHGRDPEMLDGLEQYRKRCCDVCGDVLEDFDEEHGRTCSLCMEDAA